MPYARLPGVQLWYEDSGGDGAAVVLMHAASGTSESWVYQVPAFSAAGFRCIAYDRRFWGQSRTELDGEQPVSAAEDLERFERHLRLGRFHLVATAAGGASALDYALGHPDRLRSLTVADCIGGAQDPEYLEFQRRIRPPEIQALPVELRELAASYRGASPEGAARWLEIERRSRQPGTERQRSRTVVMLSLFEQLRLPVLVIAGDADLVTPPAFMRLLAAHIPGAEFVSVPEAGHAAFWEQPEIWNRYVLQFIGSH